MRSTASSAWTLPSSGARCSRRAAWISTPAWRSSGSTAWQTPWLSVGIPEIRKALLESYAAFTAVEASHSMYVIERVAFDFVTSEATPLPAIMNPDSCEARASCADWKSFLPALNEQA